jgi:hypothetical protein
MDRAARLFTGTAMALRSRRRNLIAWTSSGGPAGLRRFGRPRLSRMSRIRWWLRTGALLTVIGILRLARGARTCWEPVCFVAGLLLAVTGFALPGAGGIFLLGVLVLIVTLLKGIRAQGRTAARPD